MQAWTTANRRPDGGDKAIATPSQHPPTSSARLPACPPARPPKGGPPAQTQTAQKVDQAQIAACSTRSLSRGAPLDQPGARPSHSGARPRRGTASGAAVMQWLGERVVWLGRVCIRISLAAQRSESPTRFSSALRTTHHAAPNVLHQPRTGARYNSYSRLLSTDCHYCTPYLRIRLLRPAVHA